MGSILLKVGFGFVLFFLVRLIFSVFITLGNHFVITLLKMLVKSHFN